MQFFDALVGFCTVMHDKSTDGINLHADLDPSAGEGLTAVDYCRLAEECLCLASLTKDPERAAELVRTGDDYLRRAAQLIADQLKTS